MKKRKNILKEAIVLLITAAMVLSTVAVTADTNEENAVCLTHEPVSTQVDLNSEKTGDRYICWDQYDTDGSNGLSHMDQGTTGTRRDLLDDFEIPAGETWTLTDFHSLNLWNTMTPPQGSDFVLSFWSDNAGSPGAPIANAVTVSYTETATGRVWYDRPEFEIEYVYQPITLSAGIYWICGHVVGPENCFWMARETIWGSECWADYEDQPPLKPGHELFGDYYDLAFQLTCEEPCEPSVDVEKYVLCPCNEEWIDADTEDEALDLPICTDVTFKIVIHNNGECCGELFDINVYDKMHDSLKFISADPEPQEVGYDPPYWYIFWNFPGPLPQCNTIEIIITAHVEGPDCSIDFNYVEVIAQSQCPPNEVYDSDFAYVHAFENKPPTAPTITGPRKGNAGTAYRWTFHSSDPNGDDVQYIIDWGDGTSDTTPCTPSCTPYDVIHTYAAEGDYEIKAKAKDCCWGLEGPESTFKVSMPRNRARNTPVLQFLQNYLQMFPMLRLLVQRLGL
jgi:hypothetical protein